MRRQSPSPVASHLREVESMVRELGAAVTPGLHLPSQIHALWADRETGNGVMVCKQPFWLLGVAFRSPSHPLHCLGAAGTLVGTREPAAGETLPSSGALLPRLNCRGEGGRVKRIGCGSGAEGRGLLSSQIQCMKSVNVASSPRSGVDLHCRYVGQADAC